MSHHQRSDSVGDVLLNVPLVQLHKSLQEQQLLLVQVSNGREELLAQGPLVLHINREDQPPLITAQVQQCRWQLLQSMPTLKASEQAYMFAMGDNIFYSVLVAPDTTHGDQQMLEILLAECTALQAGSPPSETEQSELASEVEGQLMEPGAVDPEVPLETETELPEGRIASTSAKLQNRISESAIWASQKILDYSQKQMEKHPPNEKPMELSAGAKARIKLARSAAHRTAQGAAAVINLEAKIVDRLISRFGRTKEGEDLTSPDQVKKRNAAKNLAAQSVLATMEVYDSLEAAAMLVLKSTGDAGSGFVGHRYGPDAGQASKDVAATMYSGAKTGRSVMQMRNLGMRPVATRIAKRTAKGVAKSYVKPVTVPARGQAGAQGSAAATSSGSAVQRQ